MHSYPSKTTSLSFKSQTHKYSNSSSLLFVVIKSLKVLLLSSNIPFPNACIREGFEDVLSLKCKPTEMILNITSVIDFGPEN